MGCELSKIAIWGNRPKYLEFNGLYKQSYWPAVLLVAALFLIASQGCSGIHPQAQTGATIYPADQASEFEARTAQDKSYRHPIVDEYVIGIGDRMDVVFLFHNNLTTRDLLVRTDGKVSLPYVGDHLAAGLTPMTLDSLLSVKFAEILRDPNLSVIITKPSVQKVYVLGQVVIPGAVTFESELSILGAVASAGGLKSGAASDHAVLIRNQGVNNLVGVEIDLKAMVTGHSPNNSLMLRNFDIIYVPQTRFSSTADFAQEINQILGTPLDFAFKIFATANAAAQVSFFRNE